MFLTSFRIKRTNILMCSSVIPFFSVIALFLFKRSTLSVFVLFFSLAVPYLFCPILKKQWFVLLLPIALFTSVIDISNIFILNLIMESRYTTLPLTSLLYLLIKMATTLELLLLYSFRKIFWKGEKEYSLTGMMCLNYYIYSIVLIFMITETLFFIHNIPHSKRLENFALLSNATIYFLMIWACVYQNHMKAVQLSQDDIIMHFEEYTALKDQHINDIIQANEDLRGFRHDLNNHILCLHALSQKNNNDELKKYCDELLQNVTLLENTEYTGVPGLDAILSYMNRLAKKKGISIDYHIQMPKRCSVSSYDMCTIISNLLQNALEASEKVISPLPIKCTIFEQNQSLLIQTVNSCVSKPATIGSVYVTSKKDAINHGFGMRNILTTVEKYDGKVDASFTDNLFTISICILLC